MGISEIIHPLIGGGLIGLSVTVMLLFNGRVAGISGILSSSLSKPSQDGLWRWTFLMGIILGGIMMHVAMPELFTNLSRRSPAAVVVAGFLVGYGTVMGGGCTSGHGICGVSRFSIRSVVATITFMLFGFLTVQTVRYFIGDV